MSVFSPTEKEVEEVLARISKAFGPFRESQVSGTRFLLTSPIVQGALDSQLAYMLATTWHETAFTMQPIAEYGGPAYANARYDSVLGSTPARKARARQMGNTAKGDGYKYRGRGYVQLTWKINYIKFSELLGVDMVADPDLAMVPENAIRVMVYGMRDGLFTGAKLSTFVDGTKTNFTSARKVINGVDKATTIAQYATKFLKCIRG